MIAIIDYKMGNLLSISNMFKKVGYESTITSDPQVIQSASKLVLPGVGAFNSAMENITQLGLKGVLDDVVLNKRKPILGICLGMQLMCNHSEEGNVNGLGWIDAEVIRFPKSIDDKRLRVPHIGWSNVELQKESTNFFLPGSRFYFVHSFYVRHNNTTDVLGTSQYGLKFCSAFQKENIIGVQFHPEKSHKFGMHLFKAFASAVI